MSVIVKDEKPVISEVYQLTLEHYMNIEGSKHKLDDPIIVQTIMDRDHGPTTLCLNRMMDMMRDMLLRRIEDAI